MGITSRETAGGRHRPSKRTIREDREPRADDVVRWIEKLYVPEGVKLGERFELLKYRRAVRLLAKAIGWADAGAPFAIIPPGRYWRPRRTAEMPDVAPPAA